MKNSDKVALVFFGLFFVLNVAVQVVSTFSKSWIVTPYGNAGIVPWDNDGPSDIKTAGILVLISLGLSVLSLLCYGIVIITIRSGKQRRLVAFLAVLIFFLCVVQGVLSYIALRLVENVVKDWKYMGYSGGIYLAFLALSYVVLMLGLLIDVVIERKKRTNKYCCC